MRLGASTATPCFGKKLKGGVGTKGKLEVTTLIIMVLFSFLVVPSAYAQDPDIILHAPSAEGLAFLTDGLGSTYSGGSGTIYYLRTYNWTLSQDYNSTFADK